MATARYWWLISPVHATNPYDDSDRIQNESYNNLRPKVKTLPDNVESYDVIFIGDVQT